MRYTRNLIILGVDATAIVSSILFAFLLRFDFQLSTSMRELFWQVLPVVLVVKLFVFLSFRFYRNLWRYASLRDAIDIARVVTVASLVTALFLVAIGGFAPLPRSILCIDWFLLLITVAASRLAWRFYREVSMAHESGRGPRTLIFGAGAAGSHLLHEIRNQAGSSCNVAGFVDDDDAKQGMYLNGVPILGKRGELPALIKKHAIKEVIIAIPSVRGNVIRNIVESCTATDVRVRTLPTLADIIDGKISVSQIRDVEISDLLGREPVVLDEMGIRVYLTGKKVLISGAAGSIGSEICRQVARFSPGRLILLDNAETPLFYLEREMKEKYPELQIVSIIGDVRNREKVELLFEGYHLDVVFHAAAYKHVPMMEFNPTEAVANNIGGTKIMADAAHRFGVRNFVLISSDKAVNPTNVMGASKRAAEMYVQALAPGSATKFTTVRFGNVLGSNGSVIPLFIEQIKKGGPVTVTDRRVTRYFMTIPEATQLVLQAGCLGRGGEIFVLDMGEPVRIVNLAEELIRLSGLTPYEDIDIVFTGLRPGEKLFEELHLEGEGILPTAHEKIRIVSSTGADISTVTAELDRLFRLAATFDAVEVIRFLRQMVAEYAPAFDCRDMADGGGQNDRPDLFPKRKEGATSGKILPFRRAGVARNLTVTSP